MSDDDLPVDLPPPAKRGGVPMIRTPKQIEAARKRAEAAEREKELRTAQKAQAEKSKQLAQIVNLYIGGYSFADIGAAIGATEAEVDRMINSETARFVKNQPALRTFVRNFISSKYLGMLDSVYAQATDKTDEKQLEYFDRAQKVLAQMGRLHGAEAPTQAEVKVETTSEELDKVVRRIAAAQGKDYDTDIFDDLDEDDIHEAVVVAEEAVVVSGNAVEEPDPDDQF